MITTWTIVHKPLILKHIIKQWHYKYNKQSYITSKQQQQYKKQQALRKCKLKRASRLLEIDLLTARQSLDGPSLSGKYKSTSFSLIIGQ